MPNDTNRQRLLSSKEFARFLLAVRRSRRTRSDVHSFTATAECGVRHLARPNLTWRRPEVGTFLSWRMKKLNDLWRRNDMAEQRRRRKRGKSPKTR